MKEYADIKYINLDNADNQQGNDSAKPVKVTMGWTLEIQLKFDGIAVCYQAEYDRDALKLLEDSHAVMQNCGTPVATIRTLRFQVKLDFGDIVDIKLPENDFKVSLITEAFDTNAGED